MIKETTLFMTTKSSCGLSVHQRLPVYTAKAVYNRPFWNESYLTPRRVKAEETLAKIDLESYVTRDRVPQWNRRIHYSPPSIIQAFLRTALESYTYMDSQTRSPTVIRRGDYRPSIMDEDRMFRYEEEKHYSEYGYSPGTYCRVPVHPISNRSVTYVSERRRYYYPDSVTQTTTPSDGVGSPHVLNPTDETVRGPLRCTPAAYRLSINSQHLDKEYPPVLLHLSLIHI